MIGVDLVGLIDHQGAQVTGLSHAEFDITDCNSVFAALA